VLLEAWQSTNRLKSGIFYEIDVKKRVVLCYIRRQTAETRQKTDKNNLLTKKTESHQKFSALKRKFSHKKGHSENYLVCEKKFRPPKLGARSPSMRFLIEIFEDWYYTSLL